MDALLVRLRALSPRGRLIAAVALGVALLFCGVASYVVRDARIALFAQPLEPDQLTEVVERLAAWNVAFVAGADNVRVDAGRRNALLLQLATAGVPHRHLATSAEALAKAGPLTPQSVLEAQQRDGLAGDLAASLRGVAGVEDAHVIIAAAKDGAFADEPGRAASASVRLTLGGDRLSPETIAGIRRFVAASVAGLDAERVAVLDDRGASLGETADGGGEEARTLQGSLQSALDIAFGAGATIVRVRVAYDSRSHDLHEIRRAPLAGGAIGSTTTSERYAAPNKHYWKNHASEDRGSDVADERVETPSGRVERISVAVMVDAARHLDLGKLRALAGATLGLEPQRGDDLRVEAVGFIVPGASASSPLWIGAGYLASILPPVLTGLLLLALVRYVGPAVLALTERTAQGVMLRRTAVAVAGYAPAQVRGALRDEPPHTAAAIISALPVATATAVLEMYSPEERAAIVRRMQRATAPAVPDYETVMRRG